MRSNWQIVEFLLLTITLNIVAYGYIYQRLIRPTTWSDEAKRRWQLFMVAIMPLLYPVTYVYRISGGFVPAARFAVYASNLITGISIIVLPLLVLRDLYFCGHKLMQPAVKGSDTAALYRRTTLPLLLIIALMSAYGIYQAEKTPAVKRVEVFIANLPKDLEGFTIVQLTDIHVGHSIGLEFVQRVAARVAEQQPDIIAITGDMVDGDVARLRPQLAPLAELTAKYGKFFVTGNHEYYSGYQEWIPEVEQMGYSVLINEHRVLNVGAVQLVIGGMADQSAKDYIREHRNTPQQTFAGAPVGAPRILLTHRPGSAAEAARRTEFDLSLSGHVHGGQVFPWHLIVLLNEGYLSGIYQEGNSQLYVSRGTGYWGPPMRIGAPSEITLLVLRRAAPNVQKS